jgi:hypothetical protein
MSVEKDRTHTAGDDELVIRSWPLDDHLHNLWAHHGLVLGADLTDHANRTPAQLRGVGGLT